MVSLELEARLDNLLATAKEETADIDLFAPMPERAECPLCMIPLPLLESEIAFAQCCGKQICTGCVQKELISDIKNGGLGAIDDHKCAFCREPAPMGKQRMKGIKKLVKKLMKRNHPEAFFQMAGLYNSGEPGLLQSATRALELYTRAAELGHTEAYLIIGSYYGQGIAVEQDESKAFEFFEVGAKKGSYNAHIWLAKFHGSNGNIQKFINHLKVAASAGCQRSKWCNDGIQG